MSLDLGMTLLIRARAKGVARVVAGNAALLPFPASSFDIVLSSECIEHTEVPERALAEMLRVLRPGGVLVVTCPNRVWRWSLVVANLFDLRPYHGLENWPGWRMLRRWVRTHGGETVQQIGLHMFPFVLPFTHPILRVLDRLGGATRTALREPGSKRNQDATPSRRGESGGNFMSFAWGRCLAPPHFRTGLERRPADVSPG